MNVEWCDLPDKHRHSTAYSKYGHTLRFNKLLNDVFKCYPTYFAKDCIKAPVKRLLGIIKRHQKLLNIVHRIPIAVQNRPTARLSNNYNDTDVQSWYKHFSWHWQQDPIDRALIHRLTRICNEWTYNSNMSSAYVLYAVTILSYMRIIIKRKIDDVTD